MRYPRMVYLAKSEKDFTHEVVESEIDHQSALAAGYFDSVPAALDAFNSQAAPTRAEMEIKASELNLKFDGRTSDRKLLAMIEDSINGMD